MNLGRMKEMCKPPTQFSPLTYSLNEKRMTEYEKNRPPQDRWYELKSKEFSKELYRNRMELKPNDANQVYLETLKDPYLY